MRMKFAYPILTIVSITYTAFQAMFYIQNSRGLEKCVLETQAAKSKLSSAIFNREITIRYDNPNLWCLISEIIKILVKNIYLLVFVANFVVICIVLFYKRLRDYNRYMKFSTDTWIPLGYPRNFFLFKTIVIQPILNFKLEDFVLWTLSYSLICLLYEILKLCKGYVKGSANPRNPVSMKRLDEFPFYFLLILVTLVNFLAAWMFWSKLRAFFPFLAIETLTVLLDIGQILSKTFSCKMGENVNDFDDTLVDKTFWVQSLVDVFILVLGLANFIHIMVINGFNINIVGIVVFSNLQSLIIKLNTSIKRLAHYKQALSEMNSVLFDVEGEELKNFDGPCPVCWESMKKGVRLPCGHLFHRFCLRKWLERHPLCPLCRSTLKSCDGYSKLWQDIRKSPHYGADLLFSPTPGGLSDQRHNFINRT